MRQHTPGPWSAENAGPYWIVEPINTVIGLNGDNSPQKADALLIAAAPELLAACKECAAELMRRAPSLLDPSLFVILERAANAISKAEGTEP